MHEFILQISDVKQNTSLDKSGSPMGAANPSPVLIQVSNSKNTELMLAKEDQDRKDLNLLRGITSLFRLYSDSAKDTNDGSRCYVRITSEDREEHCAEGPSQDKEGVIQARMRNPKPREISLHLCLFLLPQKK